MHAERPQLCDGASVLVADLVEPADKWRERPGASPVTGPELVLLGVEVLLAALSQRCGLVQLVAAVHAPRRAGDRRQGGARPERSWATGLQGRMQDVGSVHPEVGPKPADHLGL